jgi:hypothetical protein
MCVYVIYIVNLVLLFRKQHLYNLADQSNIASGRTFHACHTIDAHKVVVYVIICCKMGMQMMMMIMMMMIMMMMIMMMMIMMMMIMMMMI